MWEIVKGVFGFITEPITKVVEGWQTRKTLRTEADIELEKLDYDIRKATAMTKLEMAKNGQKIEADWDTTAQQQQKHTWKDEYMLFVLTLPIIGSFIPTIQDYIVKGWSYLELVPEWYKLSFLGLIAATFGLRWLIAPIVNNILAKKGTK